ncbi:MAG: PQQ-binding-like beta-propeller repeat protein [candidate division Zixibacteria bacterium]|nr:PQQ-binding-like beta-propeller repeat protein [candidate division Zixibacteria bacterium]
MTRLTSNSSSAGISSKHSMRVSKISRGEPVARPMRRKSPGRRGDPPGRPCGAQRRSTYRCLVYLSIALLLTGCGLGSERLTTITTDGTAWPTYRSNLESNARIETGAPLRIETQLWESKTGGVACGEPVVRDGYVFFPGCDRRIEVYNALTGEREFRNRFDGPVAGVVAHDSLFVFVTDQNQRKVYVYSRNPVKELWSARIPISQCPPRLLDDGSLLVATLHGRLMRMTPDSDVVWDVRTPGQIHAPPAVHDSFVVVPSGRVLSTRRLSDGSELWSHQTSGAVMATPAIDDRVYVGSTDSLLYAVDLETGRMDWFFATNGQLLTTPAIGDSIVYLAANDRNIYALNKRTGKLIWSYETGGPANQSPTLAGNILFVATTSEQLLLLDAASGDLVREFPLTAPAVTAPVIAHNRVYVADQRRRLLCFGPNDQ